MHKPRTSEELYDALQRMVDALWHKGRSPNRPACLSIPVNLETDADIILSDGIAELEQLRWQRGGGKGGS